MGLFCSLKPEKMFFRLIKRDVVGSPFDIQVSIFNSFVLLDSPTEAPLATCTVERWFVAPGVERFQIRKGRVRGALYVPPGKKMIFSLSLPFPHCCYSPAVLNS